MLQMKNIGLNSPKRSKHRDDFAPMQPLLATDSFPHAPPRRSTSLLSPLLTPPVPPPLRRSMSSSGVGASMTKSIVSTVLRRDANVRERCSCSKWKVSEEASSRQECFFLAGFSNVQASSFF